MKSVSEDAVCENLACTGNVTVTDNLYSQELKSDGETFMW